jgi:hypothetical protein
MEALQAEAPRGVDMEYEVDADGNLRYLEDRPRRARVNYGIHSLPFLVEVEPPVILQADVEDTLDWDGHWLMMVDPGIESHEISPLWEVGALLLNIHRTQSQLAAERTGEPRARRLPSLRERELWRQRRFVRPPRPRGPPRETRRAARFEPHQ